MKSANALEAPQGAQSSGSGPLFQYYGGYTVGVIKKIAIYAIYWGDEWSTLNYPGGTLLTDQIDDFLSFVVGSSFIDHLEEYSEPGNNNIKHGSFLGKLLLPTEFFKLGTEVSDLAIQGLLHHLIYAGPDDRKVSGGTVPAEEDDNLYIVFLPPGVEATFAYHDPHNGWRQLDSLKNFGGYHVATTSGIGYVVLPYPDLQRFDAFKNASPDDQRRLELKAFTAYLSHEIAEAITNPEQTMTNGPGVGWHEAPPNEMAEIGDPCGWTGINHQSPDPFANWTVDLGGWRVTKTWSNASGGCSGPP